MQHPLIQTISKYVKVSPAEEAIILQAFKKKTFKRNEILIYTDMVADEVFFIQQGALMQYYIEDDGSEHTCNFSFENEFITDLESFGKKTPATTFLKTLEPSICYTISCSDLVNLIEKSAATKHFFNIIVEQVAQEGIRRTRSLLSSSPEKNFNDLLQQRPDIFQRAPQRYIAQYLGIAPESLSRIKKRIMNQPKS